MMNDKVRKTLPLVGALALTSSALLAGTGAALAAKAPPTATPDNGVCQYLPTSDETQYRVRYDLTDNNGKWVFVSAQLTLGTNDYAAFPMNPTRWNKNHNLQTEAKVAGAPQPATMTLHFSDRKGNVLSSVPTSFCN